MNKFLEQQVRDAITRSELKAAEQYAPVSADTEIIASEIEVFLTDERLKTYFQRSRDRAIAGVVTFTTELGNLNQLILHPPRAMIIGLSLVIGLSVLASQVYAQTKSHSLQPTPVPHQTTIAGRQNLTLSTCTTLESLAKCLANRP